MNKDMEDLYDLIVADGGLMLMEVKEENGKKWEEPALLNIEDKFTLKFKCHEKVTAVLTLNKPVEKAFESEIKFIYEENIELFKSPKTTPEPITPNRIYLGVKNIIDSCKELWHNELQYC